MTTPLVYDGTLAGPAVWRGPEIADDPTWIRHLTSGEIAGIDTALREVQRRELGIPFAASDFPLPEGSSLLRDIAAALQHGRGFLLVRGLPREQYTVEECELIYWGIGANLGTPLSQNTRGHVLGHVRDEGKSFDDPTVRGYQTTAKMDFHADQLPMDVLGLFCVRTAKRGGASALVSALTIHNVVRDERPDLLEVLYGTFYLDWRGEQPEGERPWYTSPMYSRVGDVVTSRFTSRQYFESVVRYDEAMALSDVQREALDYVQDVANRPELRLSMEFQEGDMQFLNNHVLVHAREEFEVRTGPQAPFAANVDRVLGRDAACALARARRAVCLCRPRRDTGQTDWLTIRSDPAGRPSPFRGPTRSGPRLTGMPDRSAQRRHEVGHDDTDPMVKIRLRNVGGHEPATRPGGIHADGEAAVYYSA